MANSTWFYFGVRGGHGKWLKFNLMNLNRQSKLFEMGMRPVFRSVPGHDKWTRIYMKPTWQNLDASINNSFLMSFVHRIPDRRDSVTYFAFCFPYSYEESQTALDKLDAQFAECRELSAHTVADMPDKIYYHRELLCHSLDKRRVDLITISACNGINGRREPRFDPDHLFPSTRVPRAYRFDSKRVYILTSRVHPGESPSSHVFNGFLDFLLRKEDRRAMLLRRQFVFKLIPMLNPDGVARGYYRTDQLGVNLNRVYLAPSVRTHPTIYAAKSLCVFHHVNNRTSKDHDGLHFDHLFKLAYDDMRDDLAAMAANAAAASAAAATAAANANAVNAAGNASMTNIGGGETASQIRAKVITDEPTSISFKNPSGKLLK